MQDTSIFKVAVKLPLHERAAYLDQACGVNAALRLEIEGLLRAHEQPGEFMFRPPIADMATDYRPGPDRPGTRIGPYKLLQYLGEGGMGTVFLAEQSQPVRRMVALKIIKPGMDSSQILARFEAERQALAIMDHPNIAKVFDAGTTQTGLELPARTQNGVHKDDANNSPTHTYTGPSKGVSESIPVGRPYFVMELVKGVPITEFCDKNKLTTKQRLELFVPVCNAIQHAHMKGIIHRDIKPSNVLIALYDGKPVPKVIDFGVAKAMSEPLTQRTMFTQIGQIVGTFEYMSPEQATLNQLDIDTRSDIYSLGVLLYELLTGMTPLNKDKLRTLALDQMLMTIREEEPMRPSMRLSSEAGALAVAAAYRNVPSSKLQGVLRGELDWIVMKCLEKERSRRFVTAGSLAEDIERYLRDEPVTACPPSLAYRAQKAYRKNKLAIVVTSVICAVLLVATAVSILFALNANRARHLAEAAEEEISKKHEIAEKAKSDAEAERDKNAVMVKKLSATEEERRRNQYDWDFQIMQTAYDNGRIGQVQQMLSRHAEDLRGFEWYYWNKQLHSEQRSLKFVNDKMIGINELTNTLGGSFGGPFNSIRWVMNEQGTHTAGISYELQGEEQMDAFTNRPVRPRAYFIDVYSCADGRRLCHHQFTTQTTSSINAFSVSRLLFSPDGSKLVIGWSNTIPGSGQNEKISPDRRSEAHFKVIDIASGNALYEVNFGLMNVAVSPRSLTIRTHIPLFFPDGKRMALMVMQEEARGSDTLNMSNAHVRIIDLQSQPGKEMVRFDTFNNLSLIGASQLVISPDGTRLAHVKAMQVNDQGTPNATVNYSLAIVDAATGKEQNSWQISGMPGLLTLAFSPDSRRLAVALSSTRSSTNSNILRNFKYTLSMREVDTGKELYQEVTDMDNQNSPNIGGILFSPNGKTLYASNSLVNSGVAVIGGRVRAFQADTGKPLTGFDGEFNLSKHVFHPKDSTRLYHVDANAVVIRDALTGKVLQTWRGHVDQITYLGMAPDGRTISTLDNTGECKVWNTAPVRPITLRGLSNNLGTSRGLITVSRLSPDGHYVVGVPEDENDTKTGDDPTRPANNAGFRRDNTDITRLALWDATNGRMQLLPLRPMTERPKKEQSSLGPMISNTVQFTSNSRLVSLLRYRSYSNTRPSFSSSISTSEKNSPAKTEDLSSYNFMDLTVWDTATGQETAYLQIPVEKEIFPRISVMLTPDGKTVVLGNSARSAITAYDLASGRSLWAKARDKDGRTLPGDGTGATMSPDGKIVLRFQQIDEAGTGERTSPRVSETMKCELLETTTGNPIRSFELPYSGFSFNSTWSPDGKRIALTSPGASFGARPSGTKLLHVFNLENGTEVMSLDSPPGGNVALTQPIFSPDGRRIAARVIDRLFIQTRMGGNIKIWDSTTGNELLTLPALSTQSDNSFIAGNGQFAFSADGFQIVEFLLRMSFRASTTTSSYAAIRIIDATPVKK